jgi:hypothetical protein
LTLSAAPYAEGLDDDVWVVDDHLGDRWTRNPVQDWGTAFPFPTRMTVIRLQSGELWLHSPTEPQNSLVNRIAGLGRVRYLIAPNNLHYWWISDWKLRFPDAEIFAVPELRSRAKRRLSSFQSLLDLPRAYWRDGLDQVVIRGDLLTEAHFFHRRSRTLILTDLIENFEISRVYSWWYRQLLKLGGATDPDGKAP